MTLGYAWFDSYDSVGYVLTLHIFPPYNLPWHACTGYPEVGYSGHSVPIAYARACSHSIALEPCVTDIRHRASCPLAAGQARALAGWPHA